MFTSGLHRHYTTGVGCGNRTNEKDLDELPENVRREMEFVFAERIRARPPDLKSL